MSRLARLAGGPAKGAVALANDAGEVYRKGRGNLTPQKGRPVADGVWSVEAPELTFSWSIGRTWLDTTGARSALASARPELVLRMSPCSSTRLRFSSRRSRTSARVGSPLASCHMTIGSWLGENGGTLPGAVLDYLQDVGRLVGALAPEQEIVDQQDVGARPGGDQAGEAHELVTSVLAEGVFTMARNPVRVVGCRALREPVSELVAPGAHGGGRQVPELDTIEPGKNVQPHEPVVLAAGGRCQVGPGLHPPVGVLLESLAAEVRVDPGTTSDLGLLDAQPRGRVSLGTKGMVGLVPRTPEEVTSLLAAASELADVAEAAPSRRAFAAGLRDVHLTRQQLPVRFTSPSVV